MTTTTAGRPCASSSRAPRGCSPRRACSRRGTTRPRSPRTRSASSASSSSLAPPVPDGLRASCTPGSSSAAATASRCSTSSARTGFRYLTLLVEPGVFVPRPETEVVAQAAIDEAAPAGGARSSSTCAAARAASRSRWPPRSRSARVVAVDLSPEAVALTRRNAARNGATTCASSTATSPTRTLLARARRHGRRPRRQPALHPAGRGTRRPRGARPRPRPGPLRRRARTGSRSRARSSRRPRGCCVPGGLLVMEHAEVQDARRARTRRPPARSPRSSPAPDLTGRPRMLVARRNAHPHVTDSAP